VEGIVDALYYQPWSGLLYGEGRAAERATGLPLRDLALVADSGVRLGAVDYGLRARPGAASDGWELFALVEPSGGARAVRLLAVLASGEVAEWTLELETAQRLPELRGPGWRDLDQRISAAWALGTADREAAARPCAPTPSTAGPQLPLR
jgi:hypothetical protein